MSHPLDAFILRPDARERFALTVRAPADVVFRTACDFDFQSIPLVRAIFWLRAKLMRSEMKPRLASFPRFVVPRWRNGTRHAASAW